MMPDEPLFDHCSLMTRPGGPPRPTERPADCPKDGVYIKAAPHNGGATIDGNIPYPVIFDGGDGNDSVTIIGHPANRYIINGGKGDDSLTVQDQATWLVGRLSPTATLMLGVLALGLAAVVVVAWRALGTGYRK